MDSGRERLRPERARPRPRRATSVETVCSVHAPIIQRVGVRTRLTGVVVPAIRPVSVSAPAASGSARFALLRRRSRPGPSAPPAAPLRPTTSRSDSNTVSYCSSPAVTSASVTHVSGFRRSACCFSSVPPPGLVGPLGNPRQHFGVAGAELQDSPSAPSRACAGVGTSSGDGRNDLRPAGASTRPRDLGPASRLRRRRRPSTDGLRDAVAAGRRQRADRRAGARARAGAAAVEAAPAVRAAGGRASTGGRGLGRRRPLPFQDPRPVELDVRDCAARSGGWHPRRAPRVRRDARRRPEPVEDARPRPARAGGRCGRRTCSRSRACRG